jgi:hypothetical protein
MYEMDASGSGQGPVGGSCEQGNGPLGSIKCGEFLGYLSEVLCSMELISS